MIADLVGSLGQVHAGSMLSAFVDLAVRADQSNLDRLEALVAASYACRGASGTSMGREPAVECSRLFHFK
jgi:hypothetical protein